MGWISSKLRRPLSPKYFALAVLILGSVCFLVLQVNNYALFISRKGEFDCRPLPVQHHRALVSGRDLVNSIKEARWAAAGKIDDPSTPEVIPEKLDKLDVWGQLHPCRSRGPDGLLSFYNRRNYTANPGNDLVANPLWDEVFEEYSKLHRECMQRVGDVGLYFLQKNVSSGCKFLVADTADKTPFGDKILVLASSLLYAIITQRVILIHGSTLVPSYMCEPFAGSSWLLDSSSFPLPSKRLWNLDTDLFTEIDWHRRGCSTSSVPRAPYAAGITTNQWQSQYRFYCTLEQASYSETTFLYLSGYAYTIPNLFAMRIFRPVLEALFPDNIVITRLLRSAFLPANPIWKRVRGLDDGYLQPADRRVGIQLQYNGKGLPRYKKMNDIINKRIADCLIQNQLLPNMTEFRPSRGLSRPSPTRVVRVVIASLFFGLKDHLSRLFERNPTVTAEGIGVVQVSQSGYQEFSVEKDIEDFKEVLLLSFSNELLVTPKSALGSLAHGYGALVPWFIEVRRNGWTVEYGPCQRGQTIEACNKFAEKKYACSRESSVYGKLLADVPPYIENCLTIDLDEGIQLITRSRSQSE